MIAARMWDNISAAFGYAVTATLGVHLPLAAPMARCRVLALMVWVHATLSLLVPLYVLAVWEARARATFAVSPVTRLGRHAQASGGTAAGSRGPAAGAAASSSATATGLSQQHPPRPADAPGRSPTATSSRQVIKWAAEWAGLPAHVHMLVLGIAMMVLWAVVDATVATWERSLLLHDPWQGLCV
jgi:hypothetical protein